jgi:hypothetical protein
MKPSHTQFPASENQVTPLAGIVLAVCVALAALAGAQEKPSKPAQSRKAPPPFAIVFVTVWGPGNLPLYGVPVKLQKVGQKKPHWEGASDHNGEIAFRVPAGKADYQVTADLSHIKSKEYKGLQLKQPVRVHIEGDERVDTGLHLSK